MKKNVRSRVAKLLVFAMLISLSAGLPPTVSLSADPPAGASDMYEYAIETWFKTPAATDASYRSFRFGNDSVSYLNFKPYNAAGYPEFVMTNNGQGGEQRLIGNIQLKADTRYHLVITQRSAQSRMYINGVEAAQLDETKIYPSDLDGFSAGSIVQDSSVENFTLTDSYLDRNAAADKAVQGLSDAEATALIKGRLSVAATTKQKIDLYSLGGAVSVTWASDHPEVINSNGFVNRPAADTVVTLTATIKKGAVTDTAVFSTQVPAAAASNTVFSLDFSKQGPEIKDTLIGAFFEDINWGGDAGLYPEKFTNRSFEYFANIWNGTHPNANSAHNRTNDVAAHRHGWLGVGGASFEVVNEAPYLNDNNTHYAKVTVPEAGGGLLNYGYGNITGTVKAGTEVNYPGMNFQKGDAYDFSMWIRGTVKTTATVTLFGGGSSEAGGMYQGSYEVGKAVLPINTAGDGWHKVSVTVNVEKDVANEQGLRSDGFADIKFAAAGTYYLDFISLYPQDTYNNRKNGLRTDLVRILKDMKPGFLRFPGGCVAEGVGPPNRYNWKKTVGPIEERQLDFDLWNENLYSGGQNNTYYYQSFGLGYYEYMLLCEDLECEAMPVLNAGIACELRETGTYGNSIYAGGVSTTAVDMAGLQPFIDDAIDFIAFCNEDPADNKWAALRAEMGHPQPFDLEYVAIGNEQQNGGHYLRYFDEFEKQIHAIYPDIKLIHSSGRSTSGTAYQAAYDWLLKGSDYSPGAKGLDYAYAVDEHGYYSNEATMYRDADRYNPTVANYVRGDRPNAFFGEYAFRNTARINNTRSALVEAALMTGFERNADIVAMACYAPLFAKEDFYQWNPDAIWFSEYTVYGSAAYYNQKMYGANMGDYQIPNEILFTPATALPTGDSATKPYSSATFDKEANEIIIRAINPINYEMDAKFVLNGVDYVNPTGRVIQMGGDTNAAGQAINTVANTITNQRNIYDREFSFDGFAKEFYYTLKPYSSTVMRISLNDNAHMVSYVPPVSLKGTAGTVSALPARVDVVYADGHKGTELVTWEYKPDSFYDRAGDYRVNGDVANTKYDATLLLSLEESGPAFNAAVTVNTLEKQGDSLVGNLTVSVKNQQGVSAYASVILAMYGDRGKLIFHNAKSDVILNVGDNELRFDGITVPGAALDNYIAKIFVWEKDTFIPLCESEDFLAIQKTTAEKYPGVNTGLAAQPTLSTTKAYYPQHDGEIVYGPDTKGEYWYWDFSTDQGQYNGNEIRKSKDMVTWEWVGTAIRVYRDEETGKYFHNYPPGVTLEDFNEDTGTYTRRVFSQGTNFWAPYVFDNSAVDGYYYMYYCFSQFATRTSDLGVYRSKALDGVWEYCSTLVQTRSSDGPGYNAIDPMVVRDKSGRLWLSYGSFFYGVALVELDRNDPTKIIGKETYTLARRDQYDYTNDDGNNCGLEGSTIVYNPEFDYYYLSVSYDYLGNLYNTRIARSKNITGPYLDANGNDMNYADAWDSSTRGDVGTKIVAPYAYNNDNHRGWVGTGHAAFFKGQDGQYYLTHNSRPGQNSNRPYINVRRVVWTEDGWPLPSSEVTAAERAEDVSFVGKKAVAGEWEFIRLERIVTGRALNQFTSVKYIFGSDGQVGSDGAWKYYAPGKDGNAKLVVNLGSAGEITGKIYYGWDWENWKETVLFVGKDDNNTVYWGKLV